MAENNLASEQWSLYKKVVKCLTVLVPITKMAQEYDKLQEFVRYVKTANLVNENNEDIVNIALENIRNT